MRGILKNESVYVKKFRSTSKVGEQEKKRETYVRFLFF